MGVSCVGGRNSSYVSSRCTSAKTNVAPNPNPYNFKIITRINFEYYTILEIEYKGCTTFEGRKILVYKSADLEGYKKLDPHFSVDELSPIARFKPDENGLKYAKLFVNALSKA